MTLPFNLSTEEHDALVARAAAAVTLDDACGVIQTACGITDGGLAAMVFSDLESPDGDEWLDWTPGMRAQRMTDYLDTEWRWDDAGEDDAPMIDGAL